MCLDITPMILASLCVYVGVDLDNKNSLKLIDSNKN